MLTHQHKFIRFVIEHGALRFGNFTLKSGRQSPYFFNMGQLNTAAALAMLGKSYAAAIMQAEMDFNILFGPAYKGIPLIITTALSLYNDFKKNIPYCFNRKEEKDHGEGGQLIGAPLTGNVLIIDDVITAGTAFRHSQQLISAYDAKIAGLVIALDRQERGNMHSSSAIEQIKQMGINVVSIINLDNIISYLQEEKLHLEHLPAILTYREKFG